MFLVTHVRPPASMLAGALALALSLAVATPASAITRDQATTKAVAALGSGDASGPVVVFALPEPLRPGARITQGSTKKLVLAVGRERAFFFYEDGGPSQAYPHPGRVALVGVRSGKVTLSRKITRAPRVNGRLPVFLRSPAAYGSSRYRVFELSGSGAKAPADGGTSTAGFAPAELRGEDPFEPLDGKNYPPTAFGQELIVKQGVPKRVTLTAIDEDQDPLTFHVVEGPEGGRLSGQPPDLFYTPAKGYEGPDQFVFVARDDDKESEPARISLNVVPLGEPPTVRTSDGCTDYVEQGKGVAIDRELVVSDPDDEWLDRATVRIADGFQDGDDLVLTDQNGIVSSYDADAGVLRLTGTATVEAYLSALRSVEYRNVSSANPTQAKYIEFIVNDAGWDSERVFKPICITGGELGFNDPPVGETSEAGLLYIENDGPVPVDGGFVVGDPDSAYLSRATIEFVPHVSQPVDENGDPVGPPVVTHSFNPAEDELAFTDQRGITGFYDDASGLLKLRGIATLADYEAAIRSVTYENTSEDPSEATRRLQFQLTDAERASSVTVRRDAFITAINDAPDVATSKGWTWYTGRPTIVDPDLRAVDLDDDLHAAVVRIADGFAYGDALEYEEQLGIGGDYDPDSGELTLKGSATAADYEAVLRSVAYAHWGDTPTGARAVEFVTYDGEEWSAAATKVVELTGRPVLVANPKPLAYMQGDGWVAVDDAIAASDPDSEYLVAATVAIERGFTDAEDELAFKEQNGISGWYDDRTGVLTLEGEASVAGYEAALRSVMFENWSEPWSARTVTFQAYDGAAHSEPVSREVEITPR